MDESQEACAPDEVQVTRENLLKCMALIRFEMEMQAGHPLPRDAVTFRMQGNQPIIVACRSEVKDE